MYKNLLIFLLIGLSMKTSSAQTDLRFWQRRAAEARQLLSSKPQEAYKIAEDYLQAAATGNSDWHYADALYLAGQSQIAIGEYNAALKQLQKGLNYLGAKTHSSDSLLLLKAGILQAIGSIYQIRGMWAESLDAYSASLEIDRAQNNTFGVARTLNNMSILFERMDNNEQSIEHARQALAIAEKHDYKQIQAYALGNLAVAYKNKEDYQTALKYQMQSLEIKRQLNDLRGIANSLGNIGSLYEAQKKYKEALDYTHQTLAIYGQIGDGGVIAQTLWGIGKLHLNQNNLDSAFYYLPRALEAAQARNFARIVLNCYTDLSELAARRNDFKQAYEYRLLADSVNKSLFNHEKQQLAEQAKARYDWQQQQAEIRRLEWEAKMEKMKNERQAQIIQLLTKEADLQKMLAERKQLQLSLLTSEKQLLEEKERSAGQRLRQQQAELELQKAKNKRDELEISLKEKEVIYNRHLTVAISLIFLLITLLLFLLFRRTKQKLSANKKRHLQAMNEIAYLNSHKMRAPVATALGLINLIKIEAEQGKQDPVLLQLLDKTMQEMDTVVREVSQITYRLTDEDKKC